MDLNQIKCPTCERGFPTRRGMKIHHKAAHGESIRGVEVECAVCGEKKRVPENERQRYDNHFCSPECDRKYRKERYTGEGNPNFSPTVTKLCEYCGDSRVLKPHQVDTFRFCDRRCKSLWESEQLSGNNSHNWRGGPVKMTCDYCGEDFEVTRARSESASYCRRECADRAKEDLYRGAGNPSFKYGKVMLQCDQCGANFEVLSHRAERARFCCPQCYADWRSENLTGQANPNWRGGTKQRGAILSQMHGPSWNYIRDQHIGDECELCGASERLQLHHIIPVLSGGSNHPHNLMTLCISHHFSIEAYTQSFTDRYFSSE